MGSCQSRVVVDGNKLEVPIKRRATVTDADVIAALHPDLEEIVLRGYHLTDAVLQAAGERCPNVKRCKLELLFKITNKGLQHVATSWPNLTSLHLQDLYEITNEGLQHVATSWPNLTSLHLENIKEITNEGLQHIATSWPNLTSLDLRYLKNITDEGLQHVATSWPNLTSLTLWGCNEVTALPEELVRLPSLKELTINFCKNLRHPPKSACDDGLDGARRYFDELDAGAVRSSTRPAATS